MDNAQGIKNNYDTLSSKDSEMKVLFFVFHVAPWPYHMYGGVGEEKHSLFS
jgi:hypothetical protein